MRNLKLIEVSEISDMERAEHALVVITVLIVVIASSVHCVVYQQVFQNPTFKEISVPTAPKGTI